MSSRRDQSFARASARNGRLRSQAVRSGIRSSVTATNVVNRSASRRRSTKARASSRVSIQISSGRSLAPRTLWFHVPPDDAVVLGLVVELGDPAAHLVKVLGELGGSGPLQRQPFGEKGFAAGQDGQQGPLVPQTLNHFPKVAGPGPVHVCCLRFSSRYSSMVRLRRQAVLPSSLCTNPTAET